MNNTFREIADKLLTANNILIFPHTSPDGDALGSTCALTKALRKLGKTAYVYLDEEIPRNFRFLNERGIESTGKPYIIDNIDIISDSDLDITMCVDCSTIDRIETRIAKFNAGKFKICVDHHQTSEPICDYNYIDPLASAAGELVFELIKALGVTGDAEMGEAIFTAITTDTGDFQYSNVTKKTHLIVAELYDWGIEPSRASVEIYENMRLERLKVNALAFQKLKIVANGKCAITSLSLAEQEEIGVRAGETNSIISQIRTVSGVEYAVFLKEKAPNEIRVSLRAKTTGDVSKIALAFGGGGHKKAAGCTLYTSLEDAEAQIISVIQSLV